MIRRGLTLLELLIAMALTGILVWSVLGMFTGESGNYRRTREKVKMQSDAREAMRIMEEEIRNAGYANRIQGASRISQAVSKCPEVAYSGNGEALQAINSSVITTGDLISERYYELPSSGLLTACGTGAASQFREIAYRLKNGRIERRYRKDPADSSASWIPFLENVVSFQIQYGQIVAVDDYPTDLTPDKTSNAANWDTSLAWPLSVSGGPNSVVITGWYGHGTRQVHLRTPMDTTSAGEAYKVSFDCSVNASFLDSVNGYDTTLTHYNPGLRVAFMYEDGSEPSYVAFRTPTIPNLPLHYDIFLNAVGNTKGAVNPMHVTIQGRLRYDAATLDQAMTLTNFTVQRANRARYFRWISNPTSAEMAQVSAVRLYLLVATSQPNDEGVAPSFNATELGDTAMGDYTATGAAASKSHILFQRIIPVVNNVL